MSTELANLPDELPVGPAPTFVGRSPMIVQMRRDAVLAARSRAAVLISGESGTGKEVLARTISAHMSGGTGPFLAINCAALPENLVESELFGHERGAFTGAIRAKPGLFEEAHGGTLFLDEITELGRHVQAKLLRALEEKTVRRVGGTQTRRINVRVIAATNCDPATAVAAGRLRGDLYYRLRVLEFHLPPLRQRREDIPLLAEHFLVQAAARHGSRLRAVGGSALEVMDAYDWPGNVRELENAIERATVLVTVTEGDVLLASHLPLEVRAALGSADNLTAQEASLSLGAATRRLRRRYVTEALRRTGGNKTDAARLLGISRRAMYDLLQQLAIEDAAH